ncbi:hypothetical protein MBLNU230_g1623t1 [Neophaeotheca triangularis]
MSPFGSLRRPVSQSAPSKRHLRAAMACYDVLPPQTHFERPRWAGDEWRRKQLQSRSSGLRTLEDIFVRSLVAASACHYHTIPRKEQVPPPSPQPRQCHRTAAAISRRTFSTKPSEPKAEALAVPNLAEISEEEYNDLVDVYHSDEDQGASKRKGPEHFRLAPRLVVPPNEDPSHDRRERDVEPPLDAEHRNQLNRFNRLLTKRPGTVPHSQLWEVYDSLPGPRPLYIRWKYIRKFFRHLAWIEYKDSEDATQRYFSLLDECHHEGVPLDDGVWNTAIAYAGRWSRFLDSDNVKSAIETWTRMEKVGVKATEVTFNILFDLAVKAGRFALADTIHNELKARDMMLNRYFRVSMIYYAGIRGDGNAVRQAFRDLVAAHEIVDTAVMNCVIASLIRAGEAPAAEHVFLKMKNLHDSKFGTIGPDDWRGQKELGILLNETGQRLRREKEAHQTSFFGSPFSADDRREEVQRESPIAPNSRTYGILIRHHCRVTGDLDKIFELIEELRQRKLQMHGHLFVHMFAGFKANGGYAFSLWTPAKLEQVYEQCLEAATGVSASDLRRKQHLGIGEDHLATLDEAWNLSFSDFPSGEEASEPDRTSTVSQDIGEDAENPQSLIVDEHPPILNFSLAREVLRAYHQCVGRQRMVEVYNEMRLHRQNLGEDDADDEQKIESLLQRLLTD